MSELKRSLSPILLWSIGVGNVISGMYFGWNLGLEKGGTSGMAIATFLVIILYVCFSFSYAELACAIPKAGGGFDYAHRAFGSRIGFLAGLSQIIIFLFAAPAIAIGVATNLNLAFPMLTVTQYAVLVYLVFTLINVFGVKIAAQFEMVVTLLAILGILLFSVYTFPHFSFQNLTKNHSIGGFNGIMAAIPFAIWFFLGIEGMANVAEESENPQEDLSKGFARAILTLVILCVLVFISAIGLNGWQSVVYDFNGNVSDAPLTTVLATIYGKSSWIYSVLIGVSIIGIVASFHGIVLSGGRATYEFAKFGYLPKILSKVQTHFDTPSNALIFNTIIGILIIFSGKTGEIITIAVFGAITLYSISMAALIKLRVEEPNLHRPFTVPLYPILPIIALLLSLVCFIAMAIFNEKLVGIFAIIMFLGTLFFEFLLRKNAKQ
jgi:ethanolamine permease